MPTRTSLLVISLSSALGVGLSERWLCDGEERQAHQWHLVVSDTNLSKKKRKYSLSNAPSDTQILRLVYMQCQRYRVKRAIEDGKSHAGLADPA